MYLSKLDLHAGFPGGQLAVDLGSFYELHRTVYKAFPKPPGRVLFRLEEPNGRGQYQILVQSELKPDWEYLNAIPNYAKSVQVKDFAIPKFKTGQVFFFKLKANPSRVVITDNKRQRMGILDETQCMEWLNQKGELGGFSILAANFVSSPAIYKVFKPKRITFVVAVFEGYLKVTDSESFAKIFQSGIGREKSFGLGLLSIATI